MITISKDQYQQQNQKLKIRPKHLQGINNYADEIQNAFFSWRNIQNFKVVTLEFNKDLDQNYNDPDNVPSNITPIDLRGNNAYYIPITNKTYFCWRWIQRDNDSFMALTIEFGQQFIEDYNQKGDKFSPAQFFGINDFHEEADRLLFSIRKLNCNTGSFNVVILE